MSRTSSLLIVISLFLAYFLSFQLFKTLKYNSQLSQKHLSNLLEQQIDDRFDEFSNVPDFDIDKIKSQSFGNKSQIYMNSKSNVYNVQNATNDQYTSKFGAEPRNRQLQQFSAGDNYFLEYALIVFAKYFGFSRNLIIFGTFTLMIDYMLPLIIFNESFLMLAFWTNEKHMLTPFFQQIFNAKYDFMNVIRIGVTGTDDTALQILQRYGYSSGFFYNISGEFLFTIILGIMTAIIKIVNIFLKLEKVRQLNSKLRPIWNGYIFCIMPRLMMFIGFQARSVKQFSLFNVINIIVAIVILILLIVFFVMLVIQVRRINARVQYLEDSRLQIGLAGRIDFKKDFDFDCLNYSILHYPAMNYFRLLWFFVAIGASCDFHYVQYSIPIISQTFYIMISISCPCYQRNRDKVVYVVGDFLFIIISLATIAVGLAESVYHSQVSLVAQTIIMVIILQIILTYIGLIIADTIDYFRERRHKVKQNEQQQEELDQSAESEVEEKKREIKIYPNKNLKETESGQKTKRKQTKKKHKQTESDQSQDQNQERSQESEKTDPDSALTIKRNLKHPETSIKKVRIGGKII